MTRMIDLGNLLHDHVVIYIDKETLREKKKERKKKTKKMER